MFSRRLLVAEKTMKATHKDRPAVRCTAWLDVLGVMKSGLNILGRLERFPLFRDVLLESVHQIGRRVVIGFGRKSIKEGSVFIPDTTPREPPNRSICRVAEQASQSGNVGGPALGVEHARMKLKEAVFVAPENRRHIAVQYKIIRICQSFAVGDAQHYVTESGIA